MAKKNYKVIGVMSGTSLDGIDLALVEIVIETTAKQDQNPKYTASILQAETITYSSSWRDKLANAHTLSTQRLSELDQAYTQLLAKVIGDFIKKHDLQTIDAVCSHGHTILHQPDKGYTLQIGNLPELAQSLGMLVVCDFRTQDVALGGQGAPLVPIGDQLLFGAYDYCINLGGFANISMSKKGQRIAYDIAPVNVVLNKYALALGKAYDDKGAFAKAGTLSTALLEQLNALTYYSQPAPKSLGIEWVHQHIFPILDKTRLAPKDILATFTEHIAIQIAGQCDSGSRVLMTGGGTYNTYLLERVKAYKKLILEVPSDILISFKEALVFGFLGVLRLEDRVNCLASVTGAQRDHSSGEIYHP